MSYSGTDPTARLTTGLSWSDLDLEASTSREVRELELAVTSGDAGTNTVALFYGPPGTGKTLTATLLGKSLDRDVYRIDLTQVVSKYIGETEKNLATLFAKAERKDWILFFDEGDALFGKRTDVRDAHDRYSSQDAEALLRRIEAYAGVVIVAANDADSLDEDLLPRIRGAIRFRRGPR